MNTEKTVDLAQEEIDRREKKRCSDCQSDTLHVMVAAKSQFGSGPMLGLKCTGCGYHPGAHNPIGVDSETLI